MHFMNIAMGSASEVQYLLGLAQRRGFLVLADHERLDRGYGQLVRSLHKLIDALEPEAGSPHHKI